MKRYIQAHRMVWAVFFVVFLFSPAKVQAVEDVPGQPLVKVGETTAKEVTLDFNDVDLPVLVKLISELTGKNFVIDEKVRGKVSIISPRKIPVDRVYEVFLSVLELKGLTVVQSEDVYLIRPFAEVTPDQGVYVYALRNMKAEEMAKVLRGLVAKPAGGSMRRGAPSQGLSGQVQILTDKDTNTLIITASDSDYEVLKGVIEQLDKKRRQVYVEAVVLELSADKFKELGTSLGAALGYSSQEDVSVVGGFNGFGLSNLRALTAANIPISSINVQAVMSALKSSSDVNVLSTPQILTTDKQKAEIVVAQNIPFPGAEVTSAVGVQTTIERKDVGIILRLTPDVLDNERVQLDVYQEISSVVGSVVTADGKNLGPTTSKRSATTTVIALDGQTIVIGGLIRDNIISEERKVPFLGDIPVLGWLFRFEKQTVEKTNLMIFLTPHIVLDDEELASIKTRKKEESTQFMGDFLPRHYFEGRTLVFSEVIDLPK